MDPSQTTKEASSDSKTAAGSPSTSEAKLSIDSLRKDAGHDVQAPTPEPAEAPSIASVDSHDDAAVPQPMNIVPTAFPPSPPVEEMLDRFWDGSPDPDMPQVKVQAPVRPLELLERLGPSPFPRGGFPLVGFLATTYEKVSRFALEGSSDD